MLPHWLQAYLLMLMEAWSIRRDRQMQFLKLQIELLRAKLPVKHVILSPEDRARMLQAGAALGHEVDDLLGIVSVKMYRRWRTQQASGQQAGRVGRPRSLTRSARALILRMARENKGWGVRRIIGELKKLGLPTSRSTVRRLLTHEGVLPDLHRHAPKGVMTPWRTFVSAHAKVMVATDFFCKSVWTPMGMKLAYCLMFIHLGSRKVMVAPATFCPGGDWVARHLPGGLRLNYRGSLPGRGKWSTGRRGVSSRPAGRGPGSSPQQGPHPGGGGGLWLCRVESPRARGGGWAWRSTGSAGGARCVTHA